MLSFAKEKKQTLLQIITSLLMTSLGRKSMEVKRVSSQALETTEKYQIMNIKSEPHIHWHNQTTDFVLAKFYLHGSYSFTETNFQDFIRTQIDFLKTLKHTLTLSLPRVQC